MVVVLVWVVVVVGVGGVFIEMYFDFENMIFLDGLNMIVLKDFGGFLSELKQIDVVVK